MRKSVSINVSYFKFLKRVILNKNHIVSFRCRSLNSLRLHTYTFILIFFLFKQKHGRIFCSPNSFISLIQTRACKYWLIFWTGHHAHIIGSKTFERVFFISLNRSFFSFDLNHLEKAAFQWHRIYSLQTLILVESGFITNPLTPLMELDIERV